MFGDELGAFGGGVDAVLLDGAGDGVDAVVEHGHEGDVMFGGGFAVDGVEALDVLLAVVGREGDADEKDADFGVLEGGEDGVEVAAGEVEGEAAEAVVAAEFYEDDVGVLGEDGVEAGDGVFAGGAADAFVDHVVVEAAGVRTGVQQALECGWVGLRCVQSVAGGDAVAEADEGFAGRCGEG